jgi:hypothetical protein
MGLLAGAVGEAGGGAMVRVRVRVRVKVGVWVGGVEVGSVEVVGVVGSIHINSTVLFFSFSSFYLFFFLLSSYHVCIFAYLHISYLHIFKKCSAHEQYAFHQEDAKSNEQDEDCPVRGISTCIVRLAIHLCRGK